MLPANYYRTCQQITRVTKCLFDLLDKSKEYLIAVLISRYILWVITETHRDYRGKYQSIEVL